MMKQKQKTSRCRKVLVLGATGAMGRYLVPLLAEREYRVDAVAMDEPDNPELPNVKFHRLDAKNPEHLTRLLENAYDGIIDFLIYPTSQITYFLPLLSAHTDHYLYLSSYRVYGDAEHPVKESSPRLIDWSDNPMLRNSDDYCIYKARGENILHSLPRKNWSIHRPAVTYSFLRYQLVTLEAPDTVGRAFAGKAVPLPEQARNVPATMSWAGDVARMIASLLFQESACGESYTVSTAEHHTWGEIADYYKDICQLKSVWIDKEDYLRLLNPDPFALHARWQLEYDRLFARIMDNSKILAAANMSQEDLTPLYEGLKKEITRCSGNRQWPVNKRMDEFLRSGTIPR